MKDPEDFTQGNAQAKAAYHYLKNMLDTIADPVFVKNKSHQWVDGNRAFWELMGGPPEQFAGKTDYDIFPKEEADVFWEQDDKVFASRQQTINEEFLTDHTGIRRIISTKKAIFLNEKGEEVLVGIIRDISAQKQLEELQARTSRAHLDSMANSMPALVWMSDITGNYYYFNNAWLAFTGGTLAEESNEGWQKHIHPDDREHWRATYWRCFHSQQPFEMVYRLRRFDNAYRYFLDKGQPRTNADGSFDGYTGACIDITEHKQVEEAVKESEARLRSIHNQAAVGFAQTDLTGRFLTVNPRYCEIVGRTEEELLALRMQDISHPDDLERNIALARNMMQTSEPYVMEKRYLRPDGTVVWVNNNVSLIHKPSGEPWLIIAITQDITDRKQALAALRQKEQQYQSIFESTHDAILIFNQSGRLVEANPAACAIYGFDYGEFIGRHGSDFNSENGRDKFARFMRYAQAGERYFVESEHVRKDGSLVFVEINGSAFQFGGEPHLLAIVRDISERKQSTLKLARMAEESEHQRRIYDTVLSNTADFNYVFDLNGRFVYINKALLDLWQLALPQAIGKNFFELGYPPEQAAQLQRQIQQVIASGQPLKDEIFYASAQGVRAYEYIFQPVVRSDGSVEAVAGSTRDITDLKETDRRKDEFLAMLAHELRNPLAPMRNALHAMRLKSGVEGEGDAALRGQAHHIIERQLEHLVHLVDDLMDASRITQGKIELRRERLRLRDVIGHAVETAQPLMEAHRHTLQIALPDTELWLDADFARVSQIFSNLLNNAAKYTDDGGDIRIDARCEQPGQVTITVRDNGIGIPADMLMRIFEMFQQVDSSLERTQGGLGIGLTLVKTLVELQGGTVTVKSDGIGRGSAFTVAFPLVDAPVQAESAPMQEAGSPACCRVLIVDDNVPSAKTMGWMIELIGHEVRLAHHAEEAIAIAKDYRPQIVLLDIGLPGMNGYELCALLRRERGLEKSLFIAQTGWGQPEHRQRSKAAGFHHHLVKPVDFELLKKLISDVAVAQ